MNRIWQICLILFVLVAVAIPLRWNNLAQRPFHADESVQATKFRTFWNTGQYRYDPNEFHGPLLNYVSYPIQWLSGQNIETEKENVLRSVPIVFSLLCILLLFLFRDALGRIGILVSGIGFCITPSLLFYNRYYIHETLFITCCLFALAAGWRYSQTKKQHWLILTGVGIGLMYATKETFVFNVAATGGGLLLLMGLEKFHGPTTNFLKRISLHDWILFLIGFFVTAIVFFTSFFTHPSGAVDAIRTYLPWLNRAGGESIHVWPWYYYLQRYFWFTKDGGPLFTEAFILLPALLGVWAGFKVHFPPTFRRLCLFLSGYTLLLAIMYSVIPYKTPWCFMGVIEGLILLAGLGCTYFFTTQRHKLVKGIGVLVLLAGAAHLVAQDNLLNNKYYEESKNPHVYGHTVSDTRRLVRTVELLSTVHPDGNKMLIQVITKNGDCWPIPWYLRLFDHTTGWYPTVPDKILAPVVIFSPKFSADLKEKLGDKYQFAGIYGFRPGVFLQLSVEKSLWNKYVESGLASQLDDEEDEDE